MSAISLNSDTNQQIKNNYATPSADLIAKGKGSASKKTNGDTGSNCYKSIVNQTSITPSISGNGINVRVAIPVTSGLSFEANASLNCSSIKGNNNCTLINGIGVNINTPIGNNANINVSGNTNSQENSATIGIKYEKNSEK